MQGGPSKNSLAKMLTNAFWIKTGLIFLIWCISANSRLISPDPVFMLNFVDYPGRQYCFLIEALPENVTQEPIWGTNKYTADSPLRTAVVHSGWLQRGETGALKVNVLDYSHGLSYESTTQNGIFGDYHGPYLLGYEFVDFCCEDEKYNIAGEPDCQDCQEGCALCSGSASNCLACSDGYGLTGSTCTKCPDGSHSNGPRQPCTTCTVGCAACSGNSCTSCIPGYYLQNSQCIQCTNGKTNLGGTSTQCNLNCSTGCKTCYSPTVCLECMSNYKLDNMDTGSDCKACPYLCDVCADATTCTTCNSKSINLDYKCWECGQASYANGTNCLGCSVGCVDCLSADNCLECSADYILKNGKCSVKPAPWSTIAGDVIAVITLVSAGAFVVIVVLGVKSMGTWLTAKKKLD